MTARNQLGKWLTYALALFPVWLLDACVLSRWTLFGVSPLLLPVAVAAVSTLESVTAAMGFGLGAGLLWTAAYPGGNSIRVLLLTLVGLGAGLLAQYVLSRSFLGCLTSSAAVLAALEIGRTAIGLIAGGSLSGALLRAGGLQFLWSLCWMPAIWLLFVRVHRRVGSDRPA